MTGAIPPASWPAAKRAICLEFPDSRDWEALILGILKQLSYGYYWDKSAPNWEAAKDTGLQIVLSFMDQIRCDGGAVPIDEPQCVDFPNNSPILDWEPMNPFLDPSKIPPGYISQPWGVVPNLPPFPFTAGDVISGLFGLPVTTPALGQGLARCRVKIKGKGTVEIHLVKVLLGGMCLITWDDNPLTSQFIDLEWHVISLPPETSDEDINEVTFETEGDHHIDITMLPRFSEEVGFAGYGGGIRKIVLCGPDMQFVDTPGVELWREDGEDVAICESIRYNNGVLEGFCCGEWSPIPGAPGAIPGAVTQPPPSSSPALDACVVYNITLAGNQQWLLPFPVQAGDTLLMEDAQGGWSDGTLGWFCPTGKVYLLGSCNADQPGEPGDPIPGVNHMQIVAHTLGAGTFYDPMSGLFTFPPGVTDEPLAFQANDSNLADNSGSVYFRLTVCHKALTNYTHVSDFVASNDGWTLSSLSWGTNGAYNPGSGWVSTCNGGVDKYQQLVIVKTVPSLTDVFTGINVFFSEVPGPGASGLSHIVFAHHSGGSDEALITQAGDNTGPSASWSGSVTDVAYFWVLWAAGIAAGGSCPVGGSVIIPRIEIVGPGSDPF